MSDAVEQPPHYNNGSIECISAIEASMSTDEWKGYLKGNLPEIFMAVSVQKQTARRLKKAQWYLPRLINAQEEADGS